MTQGIRAWLVGEGVAWQIPPGRITKFYLRKVYLPPKNWRVVFGRLPRGFKRSTGGMMRKVANESSGNQ